MIIGITGGIASGKTYCSSIFERLGIPIYYSDDRAKLLMTDSSIIKSEIIDLFGADSYNDEGQLNRPYLARAIFNNNDLLKKMNNIVHPRVREDFMSWAKMNLTLSPYVLQESALIVESGSYKLLNKVILIDAPEEIRIDRAMKRDGADRQSILDRISKQSTSAQKREVADYIIENHENDQIIEQIVEIHFYLCLLYTSPSPRD